jgi:hypothetical protein
VTDDPPTDEPVVSTHTGRSRRHWCKRIGVALFVWGLETTIGLIPWMAHEASAALTKPVADRPDSTGLPELCLLSVVCSSLALLSLLRDWFKGEARVANALTVMLATANVLACISGAFLYPLVDKQLLNPDMRGMPAVMLVAALGASFLLAAERGFSSER